jgi:hypothetical protein
LLKFFSFSITWIFPIFGHCFTCHKLIIFPIKPLFLITLSRFWFKLTLSWPKLTLFWCNVRLCQCSKWRVMLWWT